jgi:hypothetical protein
MDTQSLPIVSFGKYKGKPVTEFLADTQYVEWCKKQPGMLEKNPTIYNIVVNQQIMPNNKNSKTPEHNRLQNLFLNPDNLGKLRKSVFKTYLDNFEIKLNNLINDEHFIRGFSKHKKEDLMNFPNTMGRVIFEDKYNWDMCYYMSTITINFKLDETEFKEHYDIKKEEYMKEIQEKNKCLKEESWRGITDEKFKKICEDKYQDKYNEDYEKYSIIYYKGCIRKHLGELDCMYFTGGMSIMLFSNYLLCCEIKPTLGDDYPEVLRKMKTQQSLSDNDKKWRVGEYLKYNKIYLLLIGSFESTATSREQLIEIFKQSNIRVKFINDIIPSSCIEQFPPGKQILADQQLLPDKQLLKEDKILIDNHLHLQQKLAQSEEKNKKLEEEIKQLKEQNKKLEEELVLLKNPTKPKTINDYFGKKK